MSTLCYRSESLRLLACNGLTLAEILMPDPIDNCPVLLMPAMGMYFEAQADHSRPHVRNGIYRMTPDGLLTYLAAIAGAASLDIGTELTLTGEGPDNSYYDIRLTRSMSADPLAALTGIPLKDVRHFLASHLTFKAAADERA